MADAPSKRKHSSISPTQRSLKHLRQLGWKVAVVEHWNPWVRIRQDLFGVFDLLALTGSSIWAIQVTSTSNVASRRAKILASEEAKLWCQSGGFIQLHGWSKKGPRGKVKKWTLTEETISAASWEQIPF